MNIKVIKKPKFENDDFLLKIDFFSLDEKYMNIKDDYLFLKMKKFTEKDISKSGFEKFKNNRPALRNMENVPDFRGSIYTFAGEERNNIDLETMFLHIKNSIRNDSRKMYFRMCNPISDYIRAEIKGDLDISCLSNIHYLKDEVRIIFRASDIKNELFADLITFYYHLIQPVYENKIINLSIYASTSQNIDYLNEFITKIEKL